jgi:hypothetical protein
MAYGLQHAPNLTISTFGDRHTVPAVGAFAPAVFDRPELSQSVVKINAVKQTLLFFLSQSTKDAHRVLTFQPKPRMHQVIGQFARTSKEQQTFGV